MKTTLSSTLAAIVLLGAAPMSLGATLVTSMIFNQSGGAQTSCTAVNVGTKPIQVEIRLLDNGG